MSVTLMKEQLEQIRAGALQELSDAASEEQIESVRVRVLGRSGELTEIMRRMPEVPREERPAIGRLVNEIKNELEQRNRATGRATKPCGDGAFTSRGPD